MSEDSKVWEKKDRRIARMSCIKSAVEFLGADSSIARATKISDVIIVAKRFEEYIYEEIKDES